jgi:uncharacterized protein YegJ (DUF2314 family)
MLQVLDAPKPYIEDAADFVKSVKDARIREAVLNHQAWLSVDCVSGSDGHQHDKQDSYRECAKLAAEFFEDDCLGRCFPGEKITVAASSNSAEELRRFRTVGEFCERFTPTPIVDLSDDFVRQAKEEALTRLPEFSREFQIRKPGDRFLLKRCFTDGGSSELMWVEVHAVRGDTYFGILENDPLWVKSIKRGDEVQVKSGAVEDWFYLKNGRTVGGFSLPKDPRDLG